uniref:Uncharacterized protein TCIL3000_9_1020 n=1 Tax=Trypanosoma congolense (strain IL3000) TaxID=1068625 RepID=G0UTJ3_TRYCI|nr:unnamed protein product [Trypanosoma congolense IL3000]
MGALGCGATEECIYVPPKTKSSAITRPQLASEERLSEVPDQLRRPSLPLKEVEAYYKSVKNELREFGDWRRVRERAYLINKYRIRVLSHATAAYMRGDGAVAKALSCRGKELGKEYERLNRIAMIALEREITERDPETTLDLHGFHVVEAIDVVRRRVELCLGKGIPNLRIVTGRGNHSRKGYSKIATAVGEQLQKDPYLKNRVKIKLIKPCYIEVGILLTRK